MRYSKTILQGDVGKRFVGGVFLPAGKEGRVAREEDVREDSNRPHVRNTKMKIQKKNRHNFHEEPEPVEMSSKLTTSGAMNSGVPARFCTWILSVFRKQDLSIF